MALTDTELAMLELERSWFTVAGTKDEAIRARFGLSSAAYYQALNALIEREDAVEADPLTVRRLRRMRDRRRAERSGRRVI